MIVVEGCDGSGKSTLVNQLSASYDLDVGVRATTDRDKLYTVTRQDTYTALGQALSGGQRPVIWDRLFISEEVYAPVIGRPQEFSAYEKRIIPTLMSILRVPVIFCQPPWEVVQENAGKDHQMPGVMENLRKIYNHYEKLYIAYRSLNVMKYDYTEPGRLVEVEALIEKFLDTRKAREWT